MGAVDACREPEALEVEPSLPLGRSLKQPHVLSSWLGCVPGHQRAGRGVVAAVDLPLSPAAALHGPDGE